MVQTGFLNLQTFMNSHLHFLIIVKVITKFYLVFQNQFSTHGTFTPLLGVLGLTLWHRTTYTGCPRRKGPNFGRVFLRSNYNDITQNTYIQSSMVTEILAREVRNFDSYYSLIDYQIHIETGRNMWFL